MLVPMAKVEIIGPKNRFFEVVTLLHEQGTLHIEDLSKKIQSGSMPLDRMEVVSDQAVERERMEDLLIRVRSIIKALHLPSTQVEEAERQKAYLQLWKLDSRELADEIAGVIEQVEDRTSSLAASQTSLESELSLLGRYEPILQKIQPLAKQIVTTGAFDSVALLVERRYKGALEQLKEELDRLTNRQCEIVSTDVDEDTTAAIVVFARTYSEPVHKFLAMENVNQIRLPSDFQDMPFDVAYDQIRQRRQNLPKELGEVRGELEQMSTKWYLRLATIRDVLVDKIDEIVAIPKFGQTEYAFVVTGWLPVEELGAFKKAMGATFANDVIVNQLAIDEHEFEDTPVALRNSKVVAPFETLLSLRGGAPAYGTVDPTILVAAFYPLFFGMIVGDIGYGLVMLAAVLWARFKFRENSGVQLATSILGPACTMAIAFGFVYGEFFGNLLGPKMWNLIHPIQIGVLTLPFERTSSEMLLTMIIITGAVGVAQVVFGMVLGIVNGVRTKHMKHVYEKVGLLSILGAAAMFGIALIPALAAGKPWIQAVAGAVIVFGIFFTIKGGGAAGTVEILGQFTNIASYLRIMAVGLAGAIFAEAVNELAVKMGVVGILIGLLLHTLNILLSAFSPNIHALRLNFLEFFGKFYEASKEQYRPFHKTGGEKSA